MALHRLTRQRIRQERLSAVVICQVVSLWASVFPSMINSMHKSCYFAIQSGIFFKQVWASLFFMDLQIRVMTYTFFRVFLSTQKMWAHVMIRKNSNVVLFSDTINVINVKLCMIVLLTELHPFIQHSVTLNIFQEKNDDRTCTPSTPTVNQLHTAKIRYAFKR